MTKKETEHLEQIADLSDEVNRYRKELELTKKGIQARETFRKENEKLKITIENQKGIIKTRRDFNDELKEKNNNLKEEIQRLKLKCSGHEDVWY